MESTTVFEGVVARKGASVVVGVFGGLAAVVAITLVSILWVAPEAWAMIPYMAVALAVLSAVTGVLWWRSRRRIAVTVIDGVQILEVDDRPPVLLRGPFTVRTGWVRVQQIRGPPITTLQAVFRDGDRVPLVLTEYWGVLLGTPGGWEEGIVTVTADASYCPAGRGMLVQLLDSIDQT